MVGEEGRWYHTGRGGGKGVVGEEGRWYHIGEGEEGSWRKIEEGRRISLRAACGWVGEGQLDCALGGDGEEGLEGILRGMGAWEPGEVLVKNHGKA